MAHSPVKTAELLGFCEERLGHGESGGDVQPLEDDLADGLWLMFLSMGMSCLRQKVVRKGSLSRRSFILNLAAALTFLLWKPEPAFHGVGRATALLLVSPLWPIPLPLMEGYSALLSKDVVPVRCSRTVRLPLRQGLCVCV